MPMSFPPKRGHLDAESATADVSRKPRTER
jgi:hypothetical protein